MSQLKVIVNISPQLTHRDEVIKIKDEEDERIRELDTLKVNGIA